MSMIELRNGCPVEERQPMKFNERIRNLVVLPADLANPVLHQILNLKFVLPADCVRYTICR